MYSVNAQNNNGIIQAVVKDETNKAISGVTVSLTESNNAKKRLITTSDDTGKFSFLNLNDATSYNLEVLMTGYSAQSFNRIKPAVV